MKYKVVKILRADDIDALFHLLEDGWSLRDGTYPINGEVFDFNFKVMIGFTLVQLQKDALLEPGDEYVDLVKVPIDEGGERDASIAEGTPTIYMRYMREGYKPVHQTTSLAIMQKTFHIKSDELRRVEQDAEEALDKAIESAGVEGSVSLQREPLEHRGDHVYWTGGEFPASCIICGSAATQVRGDIPICSRHSEQQLQDTIDQPGVVDGADYKGYVLEMQERVDKGLPIDYDLEFEMAQKYNIVREEAYPQPHTFPMEGTPDTATFKRGTGEVVSVHPVAQEEEVGEQEQAEEERALTEEETSDEYARAELDEEAKADELKITSKTVINFSEDYLGCAECVNKDNCTDSVKQALFNEVQNQGLFQCIKWGEAWTRDELKSIKGGELPW